MVKRYVEEFLSEDVTFCEGFIGPDFVLMSDSVQLER